MAQKSSPLGPGLIPVPGSKRGSFGWVPKDSNQSQSLKKLYHVQTRQSDNSSLVNRQSVPNAGTKGKQERGKRKGVISPRETKEPNREKKRKGEKKNARYE
jgi:hypothetical protein